ncbi:MAG: dolichyl-diphosphooligosaccharide--protein glycosyltransferase subunit 1 [Phylliscum demangeonii]|nr:MAG: dolichyl-diphosphooligosaccharide--protein glycosyltransferase subunit 1 [Phylliscum demangeonii]
MKFCLLAISLLELSTASASVASNFSRPLSSQIILPRTFTPPQVFQNVHLLRNINLEKGYVRETIHVIVENVATAPQDEYFLPFPATVIDRLGGLDVRDKKAPEKDALEAVLVEYDPHHDTQFYRIRLPTPLPPSGQQTLSISYSLLSSLQPLPTKIDQGGKQHLVYTFSAYPSSAYATVKQKTKIKFLNADIPDYTSLPASANAEGKADPQRQGSTFTYGPYANVPAGAQEAVRVRYEFTKPLMHATLLERDVEVSHWGGNLATEERYWLVNNGAHLATHFSRAAWVQSAYYNPSTSALKELKILLQPGVSDPYFTDEIGNVSTSHFRANLREASLEIKPRYPIFGGWKYSFRVGWNADLKSYLRKVATGDTYVLKVPFMEGPRQPEGIEYEKVVVRVVLPEGARNVKYDTSMPLTGAEHGRHKTFLDTLGRTTLTLSAVNLVDDQRDRSLIVTYDYPFLAALRKPITIFAGVFAVFVSAWILSRMDVRIGREKVG